MRSTTSNQTRSTRNRGNRNRQPPANERTTLQNFEYTSKLKYCTSRVNEDGVFMLTKRKRTLPSPQEIEAKRMWQLEVQQRKYLVVALRHKVVNVWLHGCNFNEWEFAAGNASKIIKFLQSTYPKYENQSAAKSFVYRAIERFRQADPIPSADPFRDLRVPTKPKPKRKNARITQLVDELISEDKATTPKVKGGLVRHGIEISLSTIYRIVADLSFGWTKPWHTDIWFDARAKIKEEVVYLPTAPTHGWGSPAQNFALDVYRREVVGPRWPCSGKMGQIDDENGKKNEEPGLFFVLFLCGHCIVLFLNYHTHTHTHT